MAFPWTGIPLNQDPIKWNTTVYILLSLYKNILLVVRKHQYVNVSIIWLFCLSVGNLFGKTVAICFFSPAQHYTTDAAFNTALLFF